MSDDIPSIEKQEQDSDEEFEHKEILKKWNQEREEILKKWDQERGEILKKWKKEQKVVSKQGQDPEEILKKWKQEQELILKKYKRKEMWKKWKQEPKLDSKKTSKKKIGSLFKSFKHPFEKYPPSVSPPNQLPFPIVGSCLSRSSQVGTASSSKNYKFAFNSLIENDLPDSLEP